jgi:hypothetical protein
MRVKTLGLTTLILLAVVASAFAAKSTSVNVTTIVHDTDSTGAALLVKSDDYDGSGQATYSPSVVASYIFSDGRYFLRLYGQSIRTLFITPNDPINGSQPMAPPPGYYWQNVELAVACYDQNLNLVPFGNIVTSSGNCEMILDFGYNGTEYKLALGPNGSLPAPGPNTGLVTVTCNSVASGTCVNWTITPNKTASSTNPPTVANLFVYTNNHKNPLALVGQYYETFRIDVTNP